MHDHGIEALRLAAEPRHEIGREAVVVSSRTERMHGQREVAHMRRIGSIERRDFDLVTQRRHRDAALSYTLSRPACPRVDCRK